MMSYEYFKAPTNEVYGYEVPEQQDLINQAIANGWENVTGSWPPPPAPPSAEDNKQYAANLLSATDWTTIADVGNPQMSNPYLANQADFINYRNYVRQYAVYPEAGVITWPTVPTENWVKV
jgi:hypothetical protein